MRYGKLKLVGSDGRNPEPGRPLFYPCAKTAAQRVLVVLLLLIVLQ